jgi:hypothetical protein
MFVRVSYRLSTRLALWAATLRDPVEAPFEIFVAALLLDRAHSLIRWMARTGSLAVVNILISVQPAGEYVWFMTIKNC